MRVLVVDDDPDLRMLMVFALGRLPGLTAVEAESGLDALACMDREPFDVILLDVQMPGLNGLETLRRMRARDDGSALKIVLVTGREDHAALEATDADGLIRKPFVPNDLSRMVSRFMSPSS